MCQIPPYKAAHALNTCGFVKGSIIEVHEYQYITSLNQVTQTQAFHAIFYAAVGKSLELELELREKPEL